MFGKTIFRPTGIGYPLVAAMSNLLPNSPCNILSVKLEAGAEVFRVSRKARGVIDTDSQDSARSVGGDRLGHSNPELPVTLWSSRLTRNPVSIGANSMVPRPGPLVDYTHTQSVSQNAHLSTLCVREFGPPKSHSNRHLVNRIYSLD